MKKTIIAAFMLLVFASCAIEKNQKCPSLNKNYWFQGQGFKAPKQNKDYYKCPSEKKKGKFDRN